MTHSSISLDKDYKFELNRFQIMNLIGKGMFGEVYKIKEKGTGNIFAAKISLSEANYKDGNKSLLLNLSREVNNMSKLNYPSIAKFIGFSLYDFDGNPKSVIITEYVPKGSLKEQIKQERKGIPDRLWNDTKKLIALYGIASAMKYLHSRKIIHRDLKPENILLDDDLCPKIIDFGISKTLHQDQNSMTNQSTGGFKGTILYSAPEVLNDDNYTYAGDVYSFAFVAYEIMMVKEPFENYSFSKLMSKIVSWSRPEFDSTIPDAYKSLIEECWAQNPSERPTFDQIVEKLKTEKEFVTELVDEAEFLNYIDYIDSFVDSYQSDKSILSFHEFVKKKRIDLRIKKERIELPVMIPKMKNIFFYVDPYGRPREWTNEISNLPPFDPEVIDLVNLSPPELNIDFSQRARKKPIRRWPDSNEIDRSSLERADGELVLINTDELLKEEMPDFDDIEIDDHSLEKVEKIVIHEEERNDESFQPKKRYPVFPLLNVPCFKDSDPPVKSIDWNFQFTQIPKIWIQIQI